MVVQRYVAIKTGMTSSFYGAREKISEGPEQKRGLPLVFVRWRKHTLVLIVLQRRVLAANLTVTN